MLLGIHPLIISPRLSFLLSTACNILDNLRQFGHVILTRGSYEDTVLLYSEPGLKLIIWLSQSAQCWDYKQAPKHLIWLGQLEGVAFFLQIQMAASQCISVSHESSDIGQTVWCLSDLISSTGVFMSWMRKQNVEGWETSKAPLWWGVSRVRAVFTQEVSVISKLRPLAHNWDGFFHIHFIALFIKLRIFKHRFAFSPFVSLLLHNSIICST